MKSADAPSKFVKKSTCLIEGSIFVPDIGSVRLSPGVEYDLSQVLKPGLTLGACVRLEWFEARPVEDVVDVKETV